MKYYIGIDVSKHQLAVDWCGMPIEFANDRQGIKALINKLRHLFDQNQLRLILCEASGGYETKLVHTCHEKGLPFHMAHANHIKYFAKSRGIKVKTDRIDAKTITAYGVERKPVPDKFLLDKTTEKIKELLKRREQLVLDRKREKNRLDKIGTLDIRKSINSHIAWLNNAIKAIEDRLLALQKINTIHKR